MSYHTDPTQAKQRSTANYDDDHYHYVGPTNKTRQTLAQLDPEINMGPNLNTYFLKRIRWLVLSGITIGGIIGFGIIYLIIQVTTQFTRHLINY